MEIIILFRLTITTINFEVTLMNIAGPYILTQGEIYICYRS